MGKKLIQNEDEARRLFGYNSAFGAKAGLQTETIQGSDKENLLSTIEDEKLREALKERQQGARLDGVKASPGRPRDPEADEYKRMTFIIRKDLLMKMRIVQARSCTFAKEIINEAVEDYISKFEEKYGKIQI